MPKKGTVVCQSCNANFTGILPDHERRGYHLSTHERIDPNLLEQLKEHHLDTGTVTTLSGGTMYGHKYYDVFLEDGSEGDLEANSYCVVYTERGKER